MTGTESGGAGGGGHLYEGGFTEQGLEKIKAAVKEAILSDEFVDKLANAIVNQPVSTEVTP